MVLVLPLVNPQSELPAGIQTFRANLSIQQHPLENHTSPPLPPSPLSLPLYFSLYTSLSSSLSLSTCLSPSPLFLSPSLPLLSGCVCLWLILMLGENESTQSLTCQSTSTQPFTPPTPPPPPHPPPSSPTLYHLLSHTSVVPAQTPCMITLSAPLPISASLSHISIECCNN